MTAAARWEAALARWAWPDRVRERAPASPWGLGPDELDGQRLGMSDHETPADVAAKDALPRRGSVLDVGCGTGDSSRHLRRAAGRITGVDTDDEMLAVFADRTGQDPGLLRRLAGGAPDVRTVRGQWPDVAERCEPADVVIAHNVLYNVTDGVERFVQELTAHARERVVMAMTAKHSLAWVNPYGEQLHGIRRPAEPTADLAADLVREVTGTTPTVVEWTEQLELPEDDDAFVAMLARRVCARPQQHHDLRMLLHRMPPPTTRPMVAMFWSGTAA